MVDNFSITMFTYLHIAELFGRSGMLQATVGKKFSIRHELFHILVRLLAEAM